MSIPNRLIGKSFGNWTVIDRADDYISKNGQHQKKWKCRCICGTEKDVFQSSLISGRSTSCGCIKVSHANDLTGQVFGKLTVLERTDDYVSPKGAHVPRWKCQCDCGNIVIIISSSLKNGDTKSCGLCLTSRVKPIGKSIDYSGKSFGDLTVLYRLNAKPPKYHCSCVCGKELDVLQKDLTSGRKTHCGCKAKPVKRIVYRPAKNVIGEQFGQLTVLDELPPHITPNGSKQRIVKVKCSCGNEYETRLTAVKANMKCTDCLFKEKRVDITGRRFGKLTVLSMADDYFSPAGHRLSQCRCLCDCGNETIVGMSQLVTGSTRSCGCLQKTSGLLIDNAVLMEEYDYERNQGINLDTLTARNNKKIWWKCKTCGNSWFAQVASRNDDKHHGCPYCSGLKIIEGKTDLQTLYPDVASEWNYERNSELINDRIGDISTPNKVSPNSGIKVWWKCNECGHEWRQTVANRVFNKSGCPKCNIENVNSFCEQALYYYVKQLFPDAVNSDNHIGMELDIYIPSIKTAIEYDGEAWHNSSKKVGIDKRKTELCREKNIRLIRIKEPRLSEDEDCICFFRKDSTSDGSLSEVISNVLLYIAPNSSLVVNVENDTPLILEQYATKKYENSLAYCNPEIASEWHPTKNGLLTPNKISKASRRSVWWLGKCGHEWNMRVSERTRKGKNRGCPYCSGKRVLKGFNDFESQYPEIAKEWHPTLNGTLTPDSIMKKSSQKVWWVCPICGTEYQKDIGSRVSQHQGCPTCWKKKKSPPVVCVETGKIFENGAEASMEVGLKSPSTIYACCRGENATAGGYHWKYADTVE